MVIGVEEPGVLLKPRKETFKIEAAMTCIFQKSTNMTKASGFCHRGPLGPLHFSIFVSVVPIPSKIKAKPFTTAPTGPHKIWPPPASPSHQLHGLLVLWTLPAGASSSTLAVVNPLSNHLHPSICGSGLL